MTSKERQRGVRRAVSLRTIINTTVSANHDALRVTGLSRMARSLYMSRTSTGSRRWMMEKRVIHSLVLLASTRHLSAFSTLPSHRPWPFSTTIRRSFSSLFASTDWNKPLESPSQSVTSSPLPMMPSPLFQQLASSQLELLAASLPPDSDTAGTSKIKSMALYLPQENSVSGQLEFLPAVLYPHPRSERVFIATDAATGQAPTLPRTLTKLPGFAHATTLLPGYPMVYSSPNEASVGVVEEVMCDLRSGGAALSVPLFAGSQTVGVLLVSPAVGHDSKRFVWTAEDREQVSRAAKTLSLALAMETQRHATQLKNEQVQQGLADGMHQLKNPLQALRTYGKLLQQTLATDSMSKTPQLLDLAQDLVVQLDRVVDRLTPIDSLVNAMGQGEGQQPLAYLNPVNEMTPWPIPLLPPRQPESALVRQDRSKNNTDSTAVSEWSHSSTGKYWSGSPDMTGTSAEEAPVSQSSWEEATTGWQVEMSFVGDVLAPIVTTFDAIARERGIIFEVVEADDLPGISLSPNALQEAVSNLLDNAFKYVVLGKNGQERNLAPRVRICLEANTPPAVYGVTVRIEDNGPGIVPDEYEGIFLRGHRSRRTVSVPGTGIGLDICRSLVRRMGGQLYVLPHEERKKTMLDGAIFELVLFRE